MKWRLIKFTESNAVFKNESGEEVVWPHDLIPTDYNIGDEFIISFNKANEILTNNDETKKIINTILKAE